MNERYDWLERETRSSRRHFQPQELLFQVQLPTDFCGATDWIPYSSSLPNIMTYPYHEWLDLAVANNNNTIRTWAGGCYEEGAFYDYCDKQGLMVWHDMMFACRIYPTDPTLLQVCCSGDHCTSQAIQKPCLHHAVEWRQRILLQAGSARCAVPFRGGREFHKLP
jgi:hypothetical protein